MPKPDPCTVTVGTAEVPEKMTLLMVGAVAVLWVAPMLQLAPAPLATPCWSVVGHTVSEPSVVLLGMAPAAGLFESGNMVSVGPAFALRAPRVTPSMPELLTLPVAVRPQEPSSSAL